MSAADIASRVTVTNDPLDGYVMASAAKVREPSTTAYTGSPSLDIFFRTFNIDGTAKVQIYAATQHDDWVYPQSVNFGSPLRVLEATPVHSDVNCTWKSCLHFEEVVAELSPEDVRAILSADAPEELQVKVVSQAGSDAIGTLRKTELRVVMRAAGLGE